MMAGMRAALGALVAPATITTTIGACVAIAAGLVDAWWGHGFGHDVDLGLVLAGLGALLGHNPSPPAA